MHEKTSVETMTAGLDVGVARSAQDTGMATLTPLHREVVPGLPGTADQEVRVLIATLLPGDVILTGTPEGVGPMSVGDEVDVTIAGIGTLTNKVVARD